MAVPWSFKFCAGPLALLLILQGCGKPAAQHANPLPNLDEQAKLVALQKDCADQAAKAFRAADYPRKPSLANSYTNHYSTKLQKCFILVDIYDTSKSGSPSTFESIADAFEGKRLGSYFAQTSDDAAGHILTCEEKPTAGPAKTCKSKAEWDAYKARYMETP
jgi:hypothetical protein